MYKSCMLFSNFDGNVNAGDFRASSYRFGLNGVVSTVHLPLSFLGTNVFRSNVGGCINTDSVKIDVCGQLTFINNTGEVFGGAMRIVGLSLVSLSCKSVLFVASIYHALLSGHDFVN